MLNNFSCWFPCRNFGGEGSGGYKKNGERQKNAVWALLLSLLALITTLRQNYGNNRPVVTPNEIVDLYCHDYPLNELPPLLSGLSLGLGSS